MKSLVIHEVEADPEENEAEFYIGFVPGEPDHRFVTADFPTVTRLAQLKDYESFDKIWFQQWKELPFDDATEVRVPYQQSDIKRAQDIDEALKNFLVSPFHENFDLTEKPLVVLNDDPNITLSDLRESLGKHDYGIFITPLESREHAMFELNWVSYGEFLDMSVKDAHEYMKNID